MNQTEQRISAIADEIKALHQKDNDVPRYVEEYIGAGDRLRVSELSNENQRLIHEQHGLHKELKKLELIDSLEVKHIHYRVECGCGEELHDVVKPNEPHALADSVACHLEEIGWGVHPVRCPKCMEPGDHRGEVGDED